MIFPLKALCISLCMFLFFLHSTSHAIANNSYKNSAVYRQAVSGDVKAQYSLGNMYHFSKKYKKALKWYKKAALEGNPSAQYKLGTMYEHGHGVSQNNDKALKWYKQAALRGYTFAQHKLNSMQNAETMAIQDLLNKQKWVEKAAKEETINIQEKSNPIAEQQIEKHSKDHLKALKWYKKETKK